MARYWSTAFFGKKRRLHCFFRLPTPQGRPYPQMNLFWEEASMPKSPDRLQGPYRDGLYAVPRMPERSDEVILALPRTHCHPVVPDGLCAHSL